MTIALKLVVSCESLSLEENFQGTYFEHVFSKAYEYGIAKEKIYNNLKYVFIKSIQTNLKKCIIWPKKSRKGKQEWNKTCVETRN